MFARFDAVQDLVYPVVAEVVNAIAVVRLVDGAAIGKRSVGTVDLA